MKKKKEAVWVHKVLQPMDNTDVPPGQIRRKIGDVFLWSKKEYIVEAVSRSRAVARCLSKPKRIVNEETGEVTEPESLPNLISISTCCDRGDVVRHVDNYQPVALQKSIPV